VRPGRIFIVAGGFVVAALLALLVVTTRTSPRPSPSPGPGRAQAPSPPSTPPPPAPNPPPPPPPAPPPPAPPPAGDAGDDVQVRDHTAGAAAPPPRTHSAATFAAVHRALIPAANGCADALTIRPDSAIQVMVSATLRTIAGRITAVDVTVSGAEGLDAAYATCMAQAASALDLPAPAGQPDGEDLVHLPFSVP
jgi:hypothetical protein